MKIRWTARRLSLATLAAALAAGCGGAATTEPTTEPATEPRLEVGARLQGLLSPIALNKPVKIGNVQSGKCWGPETTISAAQHIDQFTCGVAATYVISTSPNGSSYFRIKPSAGSSLCADIEQGTTHGGERLQYYFCHGGGNQDFAFDNATATIKPRYSGQCLDVPFGDSTEGLLIQQYPCNGGRNQQWVVKDASTLQQYFP